MALTQSRAFLKKEDWDKLVMIDNVVKDMYSSSRRAILGNESQMLHSGLISWVKFLVSLVKGQQGILQQEMMEMPLPEESLRWKGSALDGVEALLDDAYERPAVPAARSEGFLEAKYWQKFVAIDKAVRELYGCMKEKIELNSPMTLPCGILAEMRFLLAIAKAQQNLLQQDFHEVKLPDPMEAEESQFAEG